MDCHHYILAAGHGRRAGGPKAWHVHAGLSLLERHVRFVQERGAVSRTAIAIQAGWRERCQRLDAGIHWVATDAERPPLASFRALLEVLPLDRWGFVLHVDMPLWEGAVYDTLARAAAQAEPGIAALVPTFAGRGGHPLMLSPGAATALARLDPDQDRLDHWLRQVATRRVAVGDGGILENWNRPSG